MWGEHSLEWFIHLLDKPDSSWFDLGKGEQRDEVLRLALRQAVDSLRRPLGTANSIPAVPWGSLHKLTFQHILGGQPLLKPFFNRGNYPVGGDGSTIWAAATSHYDLSHEHMVGPAFRFIADLGDLDHCWGILAPGQSGHPASPHYQDGIPSWFKGEYHPMLFRRDEVEANIEGKMVLKAVSKKL
jgi:penicillin amidase